MKKKGIILSLILALMMVMTCALQAFAETEIVPDTSGDGNLMATDTEGNPDTPDGTSDIPEGTITDTPEGTAQQTEHHWGNWEVTSAATYFAEGSQTRKCTDEGCEATETEAIPKLEAYSKWVKVDGKSYYFNSAGTVATGWQKIRSTNSAKSTIKWCYFNKNGVFLKSVKKTTRCKWVSVDGTKYYFTKKSKPIAAGIPYYNYKYKTYVLVDISDQKLYLYKKGNLILTADVVTGTKGKHDTPTGTYKVRGRYRNCRLIGPTWNRKVSYWIPFTSRGHGLHDSQWREDSEYDGNTTYINNGSHGCINMRLADIKLVYSTLKKGSRVIIRK